MVKEGFDQVPCKIGTPIACNQVIRLYHSNTKMYLHSHSGFASPLSGSQEVSGYDKIDRGDDWKVICHDSQHVNWRREAVVSLYHVETGKYLSSSKTFMYQSVIPGQLEVACRNSLGETEKWMAQEGIYFGRE